MHATESNQFPGENYLMRETPSNEVVLKKMYWAVVLEICSACLRVDTL